MKARIYRTCKEKNERLAVYNAEFEKEKQYADTLMQKQNDTEQQLINIHPEAEYEVFGGFGAAITESAAVSWNKMSSDKKDELVKAYFSPDSGIGFNTARISIHSCDFSVSPYSYVKDNDMTLETFDISREREALIPFIKAAEKYADKLEILASPWSPPPYMKDNNEWQGGHLKPDCYGLWAEYIKRYILEMKKCGVNIWGVTVQNETRHHQLWESCVFTPEQEALFVKEYLGPLLYGLNTEIFVYDHCKERIFERCLKFYKDAELKKYIAGIACHWYSGDHFGEIRLCKDKFPDKKVLMTEGCTYSKEKGMHKSNEWQQAEKYAHDIIGDLNAGLDRFFDWNITLNEENGPCHWREGRAYCEAGIYCDTVNNELVYSPNYYFIGQFSKFIRPGAVRIGTSSYTSALETVAFKNPNGETAAVVYNVGSFEMQYILRIHGMLLKRTAPPHSVETICFFE